MREILRFNNVGKKLENLPQARNVTFCLSQGELTGIIGISGSSKMVIYRLLLGGSQPDSGQILLDGKPFAARNIREAQNAGIFCLRERDNLIGSMTIAENLFLVNGRSRLFSRVNDRLIVMETQRILDHYRLPFEAQRWVQTLSQAERYMVQLVKFSLLKAKVIVFYEGLSNVSEGDMKRMADLFELLCADQISILYLGNRTNRALKGAERIYTMHEGRITRTFYRGEYTEEELTNFAVGYEFGVQREFSPLTLGKEILRVEHLHTRELQDVSFCVHSHEVFAIYDADGSGEQLAKAICGAEPYVGFLSICERPVRIKSIAEAVREGILLVPDSTQDALFYELDILENASFLLQKRLCRFSGVISKRMRRRVDMDETEALCGIDLSKPVAQLRHDEQVRIVLQKYLSFPHNVVVVLYPSTNYDAVETAAVYAAIDRWRRDGCAVVVVTSKRQEAAYFCPDYLTARKNAVSRKE